MLESFLPPALFSFRLDKSSSCQNSIRSGAGSGPFRIHLWQSDFGVPGESHSAIGG